MKQSQANVLLAHPGTQYAPRLAAELQRHDALSRFVTGIAVPEDGFLGAMDRFAPNTLRRRWANRRISGVPAARLHLFPGLEWRALRQERRGAPVEQVYFKRNAAFQRAIPEAWINEASHVIGFDTSSWLLAERARSLGRPYFLDQSIGHPRAKERVYAEVRARFPQWTDTMKTKSGELVEIEETEHATAHRVVAASEFSRRTLVESGVPAEKIAVIPYGVDAASFRPRQRVGTDKRPLRFLFVGLVNARKGIPLLLEAWREVAKTGAELWVAGHMAEGLRTLVPDLPGLRLLGRRPHSELPKIFAECDVFVFPSFFEGFGLVLLEAMACGLPIIATDATAAPDLIAEGREGFVLPTGDARTLTEKMLWFAAQSSRAEELGIAARRQAERFSWSAYGDRWIQLLVQSPANVPVAPRI